MVSQITGVSIVCSTVCSGTDQRKYQSSTSLAFVREIPWWQVDSPRKGPVTWKIFPFDDIIMAKVSQHIYPELYFICPKYLRLRTNAGLEILKIFIIAKRATRLLLIWQPSPKSCSPSDKNGMHFDKKLIASQAMTYDMNCNPSPFLIAFGYRATRNFKPCKWLQHKKAKSSQWQQWWQQQ